MNQDLYEKGLKIRREVVGDAYVDASLKNADEFSQPMQELVTQYCCGELWSRPGINRRTRRLLSLSMPAGLNPPDALRTHTRGAINNGGTKAEIPEVFLQVAV